mmetsp:Transcript_36570/g.84066  ORF Transcript_36570/g.84066 Transcript_36570/m.84066 type:complete len:212 (+) Transcript_36570:4701-5336(+)
MHAIIWYFLGLGHRLRSIFIDSQGAFVVLHGLNCLLVSVLGGLIAQDSGVMPPKLDLSSATCRTGQACRHRAQCIRPESETCFPAVSSLVLKTDKDLVLRVWREISYFPFIHFWVQGECSLLVRALHMNAYYFYHCAGCLHPKSHWCPSCHTSCTLAQHLQGRHRRWLNLVQDLHKEGLPNTANDLVVLGAEEPELKVFGSAAITSRCSGE